MTELTEVEDRLRTGLARRAGHAPSPDAVLTALARTRPVRHRPVALWVAVAAAVAVAVVGGTVGIQALGHHQHVTTTTTIPSERVTMTVGWLPAGFTERSRDASADGQFQHRAWVSGPTDSDTAPNVGLSYAASSDLDALAPLKAPGGDVVSVQGHRAVVTTGSATSVTVTWQPSPDRVIEVHADNVPDARGVALRMADSVEPDPTGTVASGLAFGVLPAGLVPVSSGVYGESPAAGSSMLFASDQDRWTADVAVYLSRSLIVNQVRNEGTPILVRGLPGTFLAEGAPGSGVDVQLADGKWLTVLSQPKGNGSPLSQAALLTIADSVRIGQPDYSWLGR